MARVSGRAALRLLLRRSLRCGNRRYVRLLGEERDVRARLSAWESCRPDDPGVTVVGVKPKYVRWLAREVARERVRVLRWKTPRDGVGGFAVAVLEVSAA